MNPFIYIYKYIQKHIYSLYSLSTLKWTPTIQEKLERNFFYKKILIKQEIKIIFPYNLSNIYIYIDLNILNIYIYI